jgi:CheY-specific phosphatase CheX
MLSGQSAQTEQLPASFIEAVQQAVESTLASICGAAPAWQAPAPPSESWDGVMGIVSFVGAATCWSVALVVPATTAPALACKFAGFEIPFDSPDMGDVVGELANVLGGDVVARLESRRIKTQLSLPTVARGNHVELLLPDATPAHWLAGQTPQGPLWLLLSGKSVQPVRRSGG